MLQKKVTLVGFLNHSCEPNCEIQKWIVEDEIRIVLFTKQHAPANQELTIYYKFIISDNTQQKCYCMSKNCSVVFKQNVRNKIYFYRFVYNKMSLDKISL